MTHFRPICLMPLSVSNSADKILRVPPLRQRSVKKDILKIYKPIRTKFRKKLTSVRRRSAFVIFQAIKPLLNAGKLLSGNKVLKDGSTKPILSAADSSQDSLHAMMVPDSSDMTDEQNATSHIQTAGASTSKSISSSTRGTAATTTTATATAISNGQSQKCAKIVQTRKTSKCCDSKKMMRSNRDKMLQEKEDFQLAKMLQECIGTSDTSSRYSLRSRFRNKSSVSSLSSASSSTQDLFQLKHGVTAVASSKFKKFSDSSNSTNETTTTNTSALSTGDTIATAARSQRNSNDNSNDKFMEFSFQKLTRSRRIAMTMSGV